MTQAFKRKFVSFMHLYIFGFLMNSSGDDSLKFQLKIDSSFNETIPQHLGKPSLNAMAEGDWLLDSDQVLQLSSIIGKPLPTDL